MAEALKVEIGKRYWRRDGEISGRIVENHYPSAGDYLFLDELSDHSYTKNGLFFAPGVNDLDLMDEYREFQLEAGKRYTARDGTVTGYLTPNVDGPFAPSHPFIDRKTCRTYQTDGTYRIRYSVNHGDPGDPDDLVAEYREPSAPTPVTKASLLAEAAETVAGRGKSYGRPEDNFQRIADLWNADQRTCTDGPEFTPLRVARFMALMKLARLQNDPGHHDSWVDVAGYAACGGEIAGSRKAD